MSEEIVYGEFGKWIECEFHGGLVAAWELVNSLLCFDVNLLIGYAIYMLSHAGYSRGKSTLDPAEFPEAETLIRALKRQEEETPRETEEWISFLLREDIIGTSITLFGNRKPLQDTLHSRDGSLVMIAAIPVHLDPSLETFGGKEAAERREQMITTNEGNINDASFFLIDPRIIEENAEKFQKEKEIARGFADKDIYLSPEKVADKYIPDQASRSKLNAEWREIRNKAIKELTLEYPDVHFFLTRSMNETEVNKLKIMEIRAEKKLREGRHKDAIRDAGEICERLLQLVYDKDFWWGAFKGCQRDIERLFGRDITNDFNVVRKLRNKYSHAGSGEPVRDDTFTCVARTNMILKYFLQKSGAAG